MMLFKKRLKCSMAIFLMVIGLGVPGVVANAGNSQNSNETEKNGRVQIRFDGNIKSEDHAIKIEPAETTEAPSELLEQAKRKKEEFLKPAEGLFDTALDVTPEDNAIKLNFFLQNISAEFLPFYFSSGQKFDIFITNQNGAEVYRWSHDKFFTMAIIETELKKGEKLSFSEVWDYRDNHGIRVSPGKYSITVKLLAKFENGKAISLGELTAVKNIEVKLLSDEDNVRLLSGSEADEN